MNNLRQPRLGAQIALQISEMIREGRFAVGEHLSAQKLADEFHVSRQPVKDALKILEDRGIVESRKNRGSFVATVEDEALAGPSGSGQPIETEPYFQIAEDRLTGRLPEEVTETDLRRHYQISRAEIQGMLARMAQEGWIERKPGYGWRFLPVLTSPAMHRQSYEFRLVVEPAALLCPTYVVDRPAFERMRELQTGLLSGEIWKLSPARLFQAGTDLHELVVGCSGNPFFLDSLRRINRLRRLIEYRAMFDRGRLIKQCEEHIRLLDLLLDGRQEDAAEFLRMHLGAASDRKSRFFASQSPDQHLEVHF
ncbi:MAG: GntR family transcriptional regulator [Rhodospirillales bacterium]|nr:GntR family transcriptional regulator [Rhodospirillales bacterium]